MIYNTRNASNSTTESQKEKRPNLIWSFSALSVKKQGTKEDVVIKKLGYVQVWE